MVYAGVYMKIENDMSDNLVLEELGKRIARRRIDSNFSQAELAEESGVSKRTVERIESGSAAKTSNLIRILRILDLMDGVNNLVPEVGVRPMEQLEMKGSERKRVSKKQRAGSEWRWGDDK
jgi:transcriptional regulator with XRE-family HTH domain